MVDCEVLLPLCLFICLFLAVLGLHCCMQAFLWLQKVGATLSCMGLVGCHAFLQGIFPTQESTRISYIAAEFFITEPLGKPFRNIVSPLIQVFY